MKQLEEAIPVLSRMGIEPEDIELLKDIIRNKDVSRLKELGEKYPNLSSLFLTSFKMHLTRSFRR